MQEASFTGLFGALSAEHRLNMIANNLANVNTAGYKQDKLSFKDTMIQFAHDQIMEPIATVRSKPLFPEPQIAARVRIADTVVDTTQGSMQFTGNPLDVAISGEGYFRVQTPQGPMLSRNGSFCQTADGQLTTKQGWPVLGAGGNIAIPAGTRSVYVDPQGRVFADDAQVDTLQVVAVDNPKAIEKAGGNMYRIKQGSEAQEVPVDPANTVINQGFLEASNVEVVTEMVKMIEVSRHFEALTKLIQTSQTLDSETYNKIGRAR